MKLLIRLYLIEHSFKRIKATTRAPNKKPQRYFSNIAARNRYGRNQFGLGTVVSRFIIFAVAGSLCFRTMHIYFHLLHVMENNLNNTVYLLSKLKKNVIT